MVLVTVLYSYIDLRISWVFLVILISISIHPRAHRLRNSTGASAIDNCAFLRMRINLIAENAVFKGQN